MISLRGLSRLIAVTVGLPLLCTFVYVPLAICLVLLAVPQLPGAVQAPVVSWAAGRPAGAAIPAAGLAMQRPKGGYTGPESFACLLPPVQGYLTDPFGSLRPGGWLHRGIDYGTYYMPVDVRTPFGGLVVFAGWSAAYGNLVVIENGGYQVYLAHHSELYVGPGQLISAGEMVGKSGDTGNASGVHVHLEFRVWNGELWVSVDPARARLPGQVTACDWSALALPEVP